MVRFIPTVVKRFAKAGIQILPSHEFIIRILPHWVAFQKVWPLIDRVPGFLVSPYQERWLFETARCLPNNAIILEVGSYKGRSTACFAFGCIGTRRRVFVIDTFNGNAVDFFERNFFEEFCQNMRRCGIESYITPLIGLSSVVAESWSKPIHLLFIDGSHRFEDVLTDFHVFFPHLIPGGIVAVHDVVEDWPGPSRAWRDHIERHLIDIGQCITLCYGRKPFRGLPGLGERMSK